MRAAQLDSNNSVINFAEVGGFDESQFVNPLDSVIGSVWDGDSFTDPIPHAPTIPESVAMWQARSVMIEDGILDAVVTYLTAMPDEIKRKQAQAKFEYSSTVRRDDPLVKFVIPALGKTEAQIDAMFIRAAAM